MAKQGRSESGVALVEMAIALPLLILIMLGTLDFARAFFEGIAVERAARAGVSFGARTKGASSNTSATQNAANQDLVDITGATATAVRFCECVNSTSIACNSVCLEGTPRTYVRVTVTKEFRTIIAYPGIPNPTNIVREAVMRAY